MFSLTVSALARDERALGAEDELVADLVRELGRLGRELRVDHELRDPGAVAEIDEDEPAVVAAARRPAREGQLLSDELLAGLAAHVRAPGHRRQSAEYVRVSDRFVLLAGAADERVGRRGGSRSCARPSGRPGSAGP